MFMKAGATFSECRKYRYALWRVWGDGLRIAMFVGLNPSTADETADDPTIRRCIGFTKRWGMDGLFMLNAYAFRATDPKVMKRATDPVGPENNEFLASYARRSETVIACWGAHCSEIRAAAVKSAISLPIACFGRTKHGKPKHPLYLPSDAELELFWTPRAATATG